MRRFNYNFIFVLILIGIVSLMVAPPIFKLVNRVEPWVLGLPFVTFWIILMCLLMSVTIFIWHYIDNIKGNLDIDIERATEEEMKSWQSEGEENWH